MDIPNAVGTITKSIEKVNPIKAKNIRKIKKLKKVGKAIKKPLRRVKNKLKKIDLEKFANLPVDQIKKISSFKTIKIPITLPNLEKFKDIPKMLVLRKDIDYTKLKKQPLISIIIPAYNEESIIETTLKSIRNQSYKNYELIVVDNDSEDKTAKIAKKYCDRVIWCPRDGFSASAARNHGAKSAKGDVLVILDADIYLDDKDILFKVVHNLNQGVGAGSFKLKPMEGTVKGRVWLGFMNLLKNIHTYPIGFLFCKKEHFDKIGGYDVNIGSTEECDLIYRMKKECKVKLFKNAKYQYSERRFMKQGMIYPLYEWSMSYFRKKDTKEYENVR
ncbi:glycosyltransferase family 2 protein [Nanoarchaeota archaeon]